MFNVLGLIDDIYEAGADPSHWLVVMNHLADAAGAVDAVLGGMSAGRTPLFMAPRTDMEMVQRYTEHYHARNPMQLGMQGLPIGQSAADWQLTDLDSFHRSEFYNDWCLPQGNVSGAGINIATTEGWRATLMISSQRPIEQDALRGLELLAPHMTRAFRINQILHESQSISLGAFSALGLADRGVFVVSANGNCEPANGLADSIVADGDGLFLRQGRLECLTPADTRLLHRAIQECAQGKPGLAGGTMAVMRRGGRAPLQVLSVPVPSDGWTHGGTRHQVMIIVTDPDFRLRHKVESLKSRFGLTPAEANVLEELARGGDRGVVAKRLGISLATVRTQLTSLFDKTGVRRQSELVRLLMENS